MNDLLKHVSVDLDLKGYSLKTKQAYLRYIWAFANHFNQSPLELGSTEIRLYLQYLATEKQVSYSYLKSAYSALKFLYQRTLRRHWDTIEFPRSKAPKTLPIILSVSEVQAILNTVKNLKHKAIFMTIYGAGLRVSELINLKVSDIDSANMHIRIRMGKGKKDRYTLLSKTNLEILRDYWKVYRPKDWLFPGRNPEKPFSTRSVERIFQCILDEAGIKKPATVHTLRHCFATHLLEAGTGIYQIQQLLGHSSPKTTSVYIHLTRRDILAVRSPLDLMEGVLHD